MEVVGHRDQTFQVHWKFLVMAEEDLTRNRRWKARQSEEEDLVKSSWRLRNCRAHFEDEKEICQMTVWRSQEPQEEEGL